MVANPTWERSLRIYPTSYAVEPEKTNTQANCQRSVMKRLSEKLEQTQDDLSTLQRTLERLTSSFSGWQHPSSLTSRDANKASVNDILISIQLKKARRRQQAFLEQRGLVRKELDHTINLLTVLDSDIANALEVDYLPSRPSSAKYSISSHSSLSTALRPASAASSTSSILRQHQLEKELLDLKSMDHALNSSLRDIKELQGNYLDAFAKPALKGAPGANMSSCDLWCMQDTLRKLNKELEMEERSRLNMLQEASLEKRLVIHNLRNQIRRMLLSG